MSIFDGFGQRKYGEATMSYHVLIVDDDPAICKLLSKVMVSNEMEPLVVNSGAAALDLIARQSNTLDMILMDITLGDMEGFDVIQTIRRNGVTTPVIIISGRNEDYDFMYGLSLGADDYVTKPFRPQILGAKVKALIRRSKSFSQENSQQISCGPFLCDTTTMRFYKNNVELNLSEKERSLLLLFVRHPQQVFTKDMIYEQIWGNLIAVDDNAIMVYINRLRSKIEDNARTPQHIITIRGVGYRFGPEFFVLTTSLGDLCLDKWRYPAIIEIEKVLSSNGQLPHSMQSKKIDRTSWKALAVNLFCYACSQCTAKTST